MYDPITDRMYETIMIPYGTGLVVSNTTTRAFATAFVKINESSMTVKTPKILTAMVGASWACRFIDTGTHYDASGWTRCDNVNDYVNACYKNYPDLKIPEIEYLHDDERIPIAPRIGDIDETEGAIHDDGINIEFGGACPVQGEGTVDGFGVYYRSRGHGWSLEIYVGGEDPWEYGENLYAWPDGGWIDKSESILNIMKAITKFRKENGNNHTGRA